MKTRHVKSVIRTVLVGGLTALALSTVAVASASAALPELVNKEGKALVKNKFAGELQKEELHTIRFEDTRAQAVWCEEGAIAGAFSGLKAGETTFALKNCKDPVGKCFEANGELHNNLTIPFSLTLVYISKASKELGLLFTLHESFSFKCGGGLASISGDFVVPIPAENVNKLLGVKEHLHLHVKVSSLGGPQVKAYENEKAEKVEAYLALSFGGTETHECGVSFKAEETLFEEAVEFKG